MTQYAFHFNSDVCTGCKTCQVACKETYKLPVNNLYRKVYNYQGGSWKPTEAGHYVPEGVFGYFVSLACNHCTNPACVANCPTGAMQKDAGYMLKCDMCKDEIARDRLPICVAGCPMRALDFGTREEMIEKYGEGDVEVEPLPADTTDPNLILTPHRNAQKSGSGTGSVVNLEEEL